MEILNLEYVKNILDYNPETGILTWKKRTDVEKYWNTKFSGKTAGCKTSKGYIAININNKPYYAHTLGYFIHYGVYPQFIDHENHIRDDNRILNLKIANHTINSINLSFDKRNKSGHTGVSYNKNSKKWNATISDKGKRINLGYYENIDDAVKIRREFEIKLGYHINHGKIIK